MNRIPATMVLQLAVSCAVFAQAKPAAPAKRASAEQELIKLENDWNTAMVKGDLATLGHIIADDWTMANPDGTIVTRSKWFANFKSGAVVLKSAVADELKVRVYGDAAVVVGRNTIKGQSGGKDMSGMRRFTDTWIKKDGRWVCVATATSMIATP